LGASSCAFRVMAPTKTIALKIIFFIIVNFCS